MGSLWQRYHFIILKQRYTINYRRPIHDAHYSRMQINKQRIDTVLMRMRSIRLELFALLNMIGMMFTIKYLSHIKQLFYSCANLELVANKIYKNSKNHRNSVPRAKTPRKAKLIQHAEKPSQHAFNSLIREKKTRRVWKGNFAENEKRPPLSK